MVVDGACRDSQSVREMAFPYYARSVCCAAGTTARLFDTQVPISCGGVVVDPGDLLLRDDDGVLAGNADQFAAIVPVAEEIQAAEADILAAIQQGRSLLDMLNFDEHCAKLAAGEASGLRFQI